MNTLSWMLYGINIVSNISTFLSFFLSALIVIGILFTIFFPIYWSDNYGNQEDAPFPWKYIVYLWSFITFLAVMACFIPNKNTMYAIAISETGEEVYKSEIGQKATEALKQWIDSQIKENLPQKEKEK